MTIATRDELVTEANALAALCKAASVAEANEDRLSILMQVVVDATQLLLRIPPTQAPRD